MAVVELYTDGACRGNPGPGGWGVVMRYNGHERNLSGAVEQTTNNRMELQAAIEGLTALTRPCEVRLITDSKYLKDGITLWLPRWQRNQWRTAAKKPVKNVDLWQALQEQVERHRIEWRWVRGHAGDPGNELADKLANRAIDQWIKTHAPNRS